jgi:hypothetical protein
MEKCSGKDLKQKENFIGPVADGKMTMMMKALMMMTMLSIMMKMKIDLGWGGCLCHSEKARAIDARIFTNYAQA